MQLGERTCADLATAERVEESGRISIPELAWPLASVALGAAYAAVAGWTLLYRHAHLHTSAFDFGLIAQVSWNSLHGHLFATTVLPFNYAAEHFAPSLVILSPIFLLWNDPRVLLVAGAAAGGVAGVGLFLAARRRIGDPVSALLIEAAFLLAPATSWSVLDEFHPIVLALPAITFATALLWRGNVRWAALVGALALLANEDATMWVAPFGLLVAFVGWRQRRDAAWGLVLAAVGVAWLAAYLLILTPLVRPSELGTRVPPPDVGAFSWCGSSLTSVSSCLLLHPAATARHVVSPGNLAALRDLFLPTLGLGLLGPSSLVALPRWLFMVLGNQPPGYKEHYVALLVAPANLAAAEAIDWLGRRTRLPPRGLAAVVALASLVAYARLSDLPGGGHGLYLSPKPDELARIALAERALALIPTDPRVSVVATGSILPHVALRPRVYLLSEGSNPPADYRIFDLTDSYPISQDELRGRVARMRADPAYQVLFDQDPIVVMQRRYVPPTVRRADLFGGMIALDGYTVEAEAGVVRLSLYWRVAARPDRDYHYFVHLVDAAGQGIGQQDGELAGGLLRTSGLDPGRAVRDTVTLTAPRDGSPGPYHFEVGWYDLGSGRRLTLAGGGDHVVLPL